MTSGHFLNMLEATTMFKLPREKSNGRRWVSKLSRRFSHGSLKKEICDNLVPFSCSTQATKSDSITNKQLLSKLQVDVWTVSISGVEQKAALTVIKVHSIRGCLGKNVQKTPANEFILPFKLQFLCLKLH